MKKWFAFLMIPALLLAGCATKTEAPREVDVADSALLKEEMGNTLAWQELSEHIAYVFADIP